MIRAKFPINREECGDDYRPVKWPIKYPYWCTGESAKFFELVAYADNVKQIRELWPEAHFVEYRHVNEIEFSDRFPKPEWYKEFYGDKSLGETIEIKE